MAELELRTDADAPRYFLDGRPVNPGDLLHVAWTGRHWHPLRFEWSGRAEDPVRFYVGSRDVTDRLPKTADIRWPPRRLP